MIFYLYNYNNINLFDLIKRQSLFHMPSTTQNQKEFEKSQISNVFDQQYNSQYKKKQLQETTEQQNTSCWQSTKNKIYNGYLIIVGYLQCDRLYHEQQFQQLSTQYSSKKLYSENYDQTYQQRKKHFAYTFEDVLKQKIKQQNAKKKTFCQQFLRFICCQGGNQLQEIDQLFQNNNEYKTLIKKRKNKLNNMTLMTNNESGHDNSLLFKQTNYEKDINIFSNINGNENQFQFNFGQQTGENQTRNNKSVLNNKQIKNQKVNNRKIKYSSQNKITDLNLISPTTNQGQNDEFENIATNKGNKKIFKFTNSNQANSKLIMVASNNDLNENGLNKISNQSKSNKNKQSQLNQNQRINAKQLDKRYNNWQKQINEPLKQSTLNNNKLTDEIKAIQRNKRKLQKNGSDLDDSFSIQTIDMNNTSTNFLTKIKQEEDYNKNNKNKDNKDNKDNKYKDNKDNKNNKDYDKIGQLNQEQGNQKYKFNNIPFEDISQQQQLANLQKSNFQNLGKQEQGKNFNKIKKAKKNKQSLIEEHTAQDQFQFDLNQLNETQQNENEHQQNEDNKSIIKVESQNFKKRKQRKKITKNITDQSQEAVFLENDGDSFQQTDFNSQVINSSVGIKKKRKNKIDLQKIAEIHQPQILVFDVQVPQELSNNKSQPDFPTKGKETTSKVDKKKKKRKMFQNKNQTSQGIQQFQILQ